eukprot:8610876-Lingulodinium_polyedra.AAC.1
MSATPCIISTDNVSGSTTCATGCGACGAAAPTQSLTRPRPRPPARRPPGAGTPMNLHAPHEVNMQNGSGSAIAVLGSWSLTPLLNRMLQSAMMSAREAPPRPKNGPAAHRCNV